jgi:WD40 repeat protein
MQLGTPLRNNLQILPLNISDCIYRSDKIFASSSADGTLRIWDITKPAKEVIGIRDVDEILSCDFNKYQEVIASACKDRTIKLWVID